MSELALFDYDRPAYHVPTLDEITALDRGRVAVSTFSGGGGSSCGLRWAGWRVPYAVEFIPEARATYSANFPTTFVDGRDIREIQASDILDHLGLAPGELDLFEGSPPCSSFSRANTSAAARVGSGAVKHYSDGVKQRTDDLFAEWLRLLVELRPKAVLAENVPALGQGDGLETFEEITATLQDAGYLARADVYVASNFGAATTRRRLIFVGYRKDLGILPRRVQPTVFGQPPTLREALSTLPREIPQDELDRADERGYSTGPRWERLKPGEVDPERFELRRMSWDDVMPTITQTSGVKAGAAGIMHPDECRKFTPTEIAWLSGFPADYTLTGTPAQRYERIGRAVPPPMYRAIGASILDQLDEASA